MGKTMSYSEFIDRRRSSKYSVGDYVYFERITGYSDIGLPVRTISVGTIRFVEDETTCFYGVRPLDTPEDTWCIIDVLPRDMRKLRKAEIRQIA